jgi:drug/metabolite transporter superfamily protein YnfA
MATWPRTVGARPVVSLLAAIAGAFLVYLIVVLWGPIAWIMVGVLTLAAFGVYARRRNVKESARAWAATDRYSFAEMVVRMRARDAARTLAGEKRRAELLEAR